MEFDPSQHAEVTCLAGRLLAAFNNLEFYTGSQSILPLMHHSLERDGQRSQSAPSPLDQIK
jgi:hypothetical protein